MTWRLADGREFRIVKRFYEPPQVQTTAEFFIYGQARHDPEHVETDSPSEPGMTPTSL